MATTLGRHHQRTGNQGIFPQHQRKDKSENQPIIQLHGVGDRTRKTKAYLHRFKTIQSPECICTHGSQSADHLIFDCDRLEKERGKLIAHTAKEEDWPVRKCDLVNKYLKQFTTFTNSIDFEKL
jgi:hypothetical protein